MLCLLWAHWEEILSPCTPWNKGLLPLWQVQTFSRTPSWLTVAYLPPSGCLHTANTSPFPGVWPPKPESQLSAPTRLGGWVDKPLRLVSAGQHLSFVQDLLCFALCTPVAALSCVAPKLPPLPLSPPVKGLTSVWKLFLVHSSLPEVRVPSLFFCLCVFFFLLPYPGKWGFSCLLGSLRSSASVQ